MSARRRRLSHEATRLRPVPGSALDRSDAPSDPPQVKLEPGWSL